MTHQLSLPQRADVALGESANEAKLRELAAASAGIIAVLNADGREEAHRAGMLLKATRVTITATGKAAREDATAFGKAVIAREKELIALIEPEEGRVLSLRDGWDAKIKAEKDAKIAAERARVDGIQDAIEELRNFAHDQMSAPSKTLTESIATLKSIRPTDALAAAYDEFADIAEKAWNSRITYLIELRDRKAQEEAEALRRQAEREAAEDKAKQEREELAAAQAELKRQQAELLAEAQKARDALAAEMKVEREKAEATRKLEDDKRRFEQQQERDKLEAANAEMRLNMAKLAEQKRDMDHAEGLMLNAQFDQLAAARKLEEETAAVAVVESPLTEKLTATWWVSLDTTCPHCNADVNLLDYADFWDGRRFTVPEHGTDRTKGVDVNCPECMTDFKVDLDY